MPNPPLLKSPLATSPRLVATDLDGTLLRGDGSVSARTVRALAAVEAAGIEAVFVTARPPRWLGELAHVVGAHGVALCSNGAFVYDVRAGLVSEQHCLDESTVHELAADLRAAVPGIVFAVEWSDGAGREPAYTYRRELPSDAPIRPVEQLATRPIGKLVARCDALDPSCFLALVEAVVGERAELAYSGAVGLAEMTARGVTKAAGLSRWCAQRGVAAEDVWAFGDMPNDLPMLRWAGHSFGVRNAHPDVLAVVDEVCGSSDEDGVAVVLESLRSAAAQR